MKKNKICSFLTDGSGGITQFELFKSILELGKAGTLQKHPLFSHECITSQEVFLIYDLFNIDETSCTKISSLGRRKATALLLFYIIYIMYFNYSYAKEL